MNDESQASESSDAGDQTSMADVAATVQISEGEAAPSTPEPTGDGSNVKDFQAYAEQLQAMQKQVQSNTEAVRKVTSESEAKALDTEIKAAAEIINENLDQGKSDMAEIFLEAQYRKNPDLQKVWNNRATNPEALKKALGLLQKEFEALNDTVVDPDVRENQRALRAAQQTGGTVQDTSESDKFNQMSDAQFMREIRTIARSG